MARGKTKFEKIVLVRRKTMLEELTARLNTPAQARFYLEHAGQVFEPIEQAHNQYHQVLKSVREWLPEKVKNHVIDRDYLPQFVFNEDDLVVTVGIDGLVVNTAKYTTNQPILAVNPDPKTIDGILLPFTSETFPIGLESVMRGEEKIRKVTMAKVMLQDKQELLAFNDFFIGAKSHVSARYEIQQGSAREMHSSSGIIISTGAGSTGWLQSVYTGAAGIITSLGGHVVPPPNNGRFDWDADWLIYSVREPFPSKVTRTSMIYGVIHPDKPLKVTSNMAENGVIFSDGIESDYLNFNSGTEATVTLADHKASLVVC